MIPNINKTVDIVLRHSKQRDAILENLRARYDHPTADMIYSDMKEIMPNISLGTVYRNLSLLCETGDIIKIGASIDGKERYDGHTESHAHFFCEECGAVYDTTAYLDVSRIESEIGAKINYASNTLRGICKECLKKSSI